MYRPLDKRLDSWFAAFKAADGEINVVYYDLEVAFAFGHFFAKEHDNSKVCGPSCRCLSTACPPVRLSPPFERQLLTVFSHPRYSPASKNCCSGR